MIIDIISFVFVKLLALIGLALIFGIPALGAWFITIGPTDEKEGFDCLSKKPARYIYWGTAGPFFLMAYILFVSWAWPFGVERPAGNKHMTAAMWHTVTDNWQQHETRWASDPVVTRTEDGSEVRRFILVTYNPPKHFYVTLKDVETGTVYESRYVSKHCNSHTSLVKGEQYNLQVRYFRLSSNPEQRLIEFTNLSREFCG